MTPTPQRCPRCGDLLRACGGPLYHAYTEEERSARILRGPTPEDDHHDDGSVAGTVWACIGMVVVWALVGWWWCST